MYAGVEKGVVEGFLVGYDGVQLLRHQFADDTFFFYYEKENSFRNLNEFLFFFQPILGLRINQWKNTIFEVSVSLQS